MRVGSLFSGIGGIELGFQQAGFELAWAIEKDAKCCETYRYNFGKDCLIQKDVRSVEVSFLSPIDILTAGFPCQSFSVAGKQRGFDDPRGHLFFEVERFIKHHKPRIVFIENVANLIEHDEGKTFNVIHNTLSSQGYFIRYRVLRASEYGGIPQIRDRTYIVAFKLQKDCDWFTFPAKIDLDFDIEQVLNRHSKKHSLYYYGDDTPFSRKAKEIVTNKRGIYRVFNGDIKIINNNMCPTLTASMGTKQDQIPLILDDFGVRKITVRECLVFQGFPDEFTFPQTITINDAYKQIGNSVCVPVIRRIAEKIIEVM